MATKLSAHDLRAFWNSKKGAGAAKGISDHDLRSFYNSQNGPGAAGGAAPTLSNGSPIETTTGGGTDTPTDTPAAVDPLDPKYIERFEKTIGLGKEFGNGLIDDLGLRGEFLGRIQEGPGEDYYADLAALRARTQNADQLSALDEEALAQARLGLGGLDSAENAALRSAAKQNVNRQFGLEEQKLLRYQGGMGSSMQRAAQMADLSRNRVDSQRSLERDLLVENIQQKKDARLAFSNLTNAVGARQDSRVQNLSALLQSGNQFADSMTMQGQQFNTGTAAQEQAARTGAYVGGIGTTMSALGGYAAEEFQTKALEEALKAKREEIEATKQLTASSLAAQQQIINSLAGQF